MESAKFIDSGVQAKPPTGVEWSIYEKHCDPDARGIFEMLKGAGFGGVGGFSGSAEAGALGGSSGFGGITTSESGQLDTLGSSLYSALRMDPEICRRIGLPAYTVSTFTNEDTSKPKGKGGATKVQKGKGISAQDIRHRKALEKAKTKGDKFLASCSRENWASIPIGKLNEPIESLVLDFLQHINGFCENFKRIDKSRVYDLVFGVGKLVENLKVLQVRNYETTKLELVNPMLISDLETKIQELKDLSKFKIIKAAVDAPKVLVKTSYDGVIPGTKASLYESQAKLIEVMYANRDNGLLALLATLTGEGKTTLIVAIAAILQAWNRSSSLCHQVIYCSSQKLKTIEIQVGQNAYNSQIPFGIATLKHNADGSSSVKISDNYNCRKFNEKRVLTIADIVSTIKLLEQQLEAKKNLPALETKLATSTMQSKELERRITSIVRGIDTLSTGETLPQLRASLVDLNKKLTKESEKVGKIRDIASKQYVLFFDEPTVDLDQKDSPMISYLAQLFELMPKFTILSTATAPERESIPMLETQFCAKFPGTGVEFIKSTKVRIGSEIADFDGNIFIPHANCVSVEQYKYVVRKIESDCFLQKCYTPNVTSELFRKLKKLCKVHGFTIPSELDFERYLSATSNMNQDAICKLAIKYLYIVINVVEAVPTTTADAIITKFCSSHFTKRGINFASLATSAEHFESQTLIVTAEPADFFESYFGDYVTRASEFISKTNGFDHGVGFDEMYRAYCTANTRYALAVEKIESQQLKSKSKPKSRSKTGDFDKSGAEHEAQRELSLGDLGSRPELTIPLRLVIGSSSYMKERGASSTLNTFIPETVKWDEVECSDLLKFGLCVGVGAYSRRYHSSYTQLVLELASSGKLAYLIADDAICYGANYPIETVIVDNTCLTAESHSVKTVFQVFARAGRPGKSWRANVFADPTVLAMIHNYIHNPDFVDIEVYNMNLALTEAILAPERKARAEVERVEREARAEVLRVEHEARVELLRVEHEARVELLRVEREVEALKSAKWRPGQGKWRK